MINLTIISRGTRYTHYHPLHLSLSCQSKAPRSRHGTRSPANTQKGARILRAQNRPQVARLKSRAKCGDLECKKRKNRPEVPITRPQ